MGYYGSTFREIARDNYAEAMVPRLSLRLANGSNGLPYSEDFSAWTASANVVVAATGPAEDPPFGSPHLILLTGTPSAWEYIRLQRASTLEDRFVFWILAHEYDPGAPGVGLTYLLHNHDSGSGDVTTSARFSWSGGVPTAGTVDGDGISGVVDMGGGWYKLWWAADVEEQDIVKGGTHSFRVYADGGVGTAGRGLYVAHAQLELGTASSGPRLAEDQQEGPWGAVATDGEEVPDGAIGQLVEVDSVETTIQANPVVVKRDARFGFIHAQQWQAVFTNETLAISQRDLAGAWAALEMGFPQEDEWALAAQGRVSIGKASTDLRVSIDVDSPMSAAVDGQLLRSVFFDSAAAHASAVIDVERDGSSDGYDNDASGAGVTITTDVYVVEQIVEIEFLSATTFKFVYEDGTEDDNGGAGYPIASDASPSLSGWTLEAEGWTGTYAAGDRFRFDLSKRRSGTNATTPIALLSEILTDDLFLGLRVYNVLGGYYYGTPLYDEAASWDGVVADYSTTTLKGEWEAGTDTVDLIQGILRIVNASIYTMPNGQIALWESVPNELSPTILNGDPDRGDIHILHVEQTDSLDDVYNVVRYRYLSLADGSAAELIRRDPDSQLKVDRILVVDVGNWRVNNTAIDVAASKVINRVKGNRRGYTIRTNLAGAVISMDEPIAFYEPMLGLSVTSLVREIAVDLMANEARLVAQIDPVVLNNYAVVGVSTVGGADLVF